MKLTDKKRDRNNTYNSNFVDTLMGTEIGVGR